VAAEQTDATTDPQPCTVCRGTGTVQSNLGGTPSTVACPWCEGTGTYLGAEHDAQAVGRDEDA